MIVTTDHESNIQNCVCTYKYRQLNMFNVNNVYLIPYDLTGREKMNSKIRESNYFKLTFL